MFLSRHGWILRVIVQATGRAQTYPTAVGASEECYLESSGSQGAMCTDNLNLLNQDFGWLAVLWRRFDKALTVTTTVAGMVNCMNNMYIPPNTYSSAILSRLEDTDQVKARPPSP
jgi:hypothetical protein